MYQSLLINHQIINTINDLNILSDFTTHLTFSNDFNESIDNLQQSYCPIGQKCTACSFYSTSLKKCINYRFNSLTHLTFGECFNQLIDNLPNSITHLTFGYNSKINIRTTFGTDSKFNQSINNLPRTLSNER